MKKFLVPVQKLAHKPQLGQVVQKVGSRSTKHSQEVSSFEQAETQNKIKHDVSRLFFSL